MSGTAIDATTRERGELERLAADVSWRALEEQEGALRDLRARAGPLLTAASLTVSFLGAQAIAREGLGIVAWLAIGAFAVSLFASLYLLLPKDGLVFAVDGPELYVELRTATVALVAQVALWGLHLSSIL